MFYICNETLSYDAVAVLKVHGFDDLTPDIALCSKKIFQDSKGNQYRFVGWDSNRPQSGPPYGIWLEKIKSTTHN